MRLIAGSFRSLFVFSVVIGLQCSGRKQHKFIPELRQMMQTLNNEAREILPLLEPTATPQEVLVGLRRIDKAIEFNTRESLRLLTKYPEIHAHTNEIELDLKTEFDLLRRNMGQAAKAIDYWKKQFKKIPQYETLFDRIDKKVRNANRQTRPQ